MHLKLEYYIPLFWLSFVDGCCLIGWTVLFEGGSCLTGWEVLFKVGNCLMGWEVLFRVGNCLVGCVVLLNGGKVDLTGCVVVWTVVLLWGMGMSFCIVSFCFGFTLNMSLNLPSLLLIEESVSTDSWSLKGSQASPLVCALVLLLVS